MPEEMPGFETYDPKSALEINYRDRRVLVLQMDKPCDWVIVPGFIYIGENPDPAKIANHYQYNPLSGIYDKVIPIEYVPEKNLAELEKIVKELGFKGSVNIWRKPKC